MARKPNGREVYLKVFISYSIGDYDIVKRVASAIKAHCEVYYWEQNKALGDPAWAQIFNWIDKCDFVIALITDRTVSRAMAVGQEIARAVTRGKIVIPLVGLEVPETELGCLKNLAFERIDPRNPGAAIEKVIDRIFPKPVSIESQAINQGPVDWKQVVLITGLIILVVWAFTSAES